MFDPCEICGARHHPRQAHRFSSQPLVTPASNTASNKSESSAAKDVGAEVVARAAKEIAKLKQRWDRGKYNEYQRELMRVRRAKEREKRRAAARAGLGGGVA